MLPKKKRLGPFLICCDRHGNSSRGADTDHVVSGEDFIIEQFEALLSCHSKTGQTSLNPGPDSPEHSDQDSDTYGCTRLRRSWGLNEEE